MVGAEGLVGCTAVMVVGCTAVMVVGGTAVLVACARGRAGAAGGGPCIFCAAVMGPGGTDAGTHAGGTDAGTYAGSTDAGTEEARASRWLSGESLPERPGRGTWSSSTASRSHWLPALPSICITFCVS